MGGFCEVAVPLLDWLWGSICAAASGLAEAVGAAALPAPPLAGGCDAAPRRPPGGPGGLLRRSRSGDAAYDAAQSATNPSSSFSVRNLSGSKVPLRLRSDTACGVCMPHHACKQMYVIWFVLSTAGPRLVALGPTFRFLFPRFLGLLP